ncbi:hypothetical protein EXIGLDRAFT_52318 [Exidia glandulosa HHB12029]|uniref:F-box domain-containing protein n=1 Tax=Exidia glandulosa HHB12029 TaxID=1314781 RepID=A0A165ICF9_EXIGL|nr:hypothetical protein EXIGLDRAFT_52318 [Exidia glandulosa HHB12029]
MVAVLNEDVLIEIVSWASPPTLRTLARASKLIHKFVVPVLWRIVSIELSLESGQRCARILCERPAFGRAVHSLDVAVGGQASDIMLASSAGTLLDVLIAVPNLRSLRLSNSLSVYLHSHIVGRRGALQQLRITSLSLSHHMAHHAAGDMLDYVPALRHLRLDCAPDDDAVHALLERSRNTLESLEMWRSSIATALSALPHSVWPRVTRLQAHVVDGLNDAFPNARIVAPPEGRFVDLDAVRILRSEGLPDLEFLPIAFTKITEPIQLHASGAKRSFVGLEWSSAHRTSPRDYPNALQRVEALLSYINTDLLTTLIFVIEPSFLDFPLAAAIIALCPRVQHLGARAEDWSECSRFLDGLLTISSDVPLRYVGVSCATLLYQVREDARAHAPRVIAHFPSLRLLEAKGAFSERLGVLRYVVSREASRHYWEEERDSYDTCVFDVLRSDPSELRHMDVLQ